MTPTRTWLQRVVAALAWVIRRTLGISGTEALSAAANIFLGQTEAPLTVKPFIAGMTRSQIMCIMVGGFATSPIPLVNASIVGDDVVFHKDVNLGIAVALDWGLIVPVIRRADELSLVGLARAAQLTYRHTATAGCEDVNECSAQTSTCGGTASGEDVRWFTTCGAPQFFSLCEGDGGAYTSRRTSSETTRWCPSRSTFARIASLFALSFSNS